MSFVAFNGWSVLHAGTVRLPAARGRWAPGGAEAFSQQRLSTDAVGSTVLTLTNVVAGSRYRVERQADGALVAEGTAAATTVPLTLDYFAEGDAQNDVRIKVRKGTSAPKYQPFQTQTTLGAANQSVYIAQVADNIA